MARVTVGEKADCDEFSSLWQMSLSNTILLECYAGGSATERSGTSHLVSALIACAIVVGFLCGGKLLALQLERKTVHWAAPRDFFIKNQGLAFERAAAHRPDILLLYGSSELTDPIPNRASDFFSNAPTGFQVCPVGKAGTTSLIILQKLGALGPELRGHKVAISLSASSFFRPDGEAGFYAGNFSLPEPRCSLQQCH